MGPLVAIGLGALLLVCGIGLIYQAFEARKTDGHIGAFCLIVGVIAAGSGPLLTMSVFWSY